MTPKELLDRLNRGAEVDWSTFEDVVFEAAQKALFGPSSPWVEVERNKKGPIDIVITVRQRTLDFGGRRLPGMSTQTAYIECKHHSRPLEFSDAAKVFCVAMKDSPNTLVIISSTDMAPQAWEYARHFFSVDESRGVFAGVHFDHWLLADFLGVPAARATRAEPVARPRSWVLRASDAFTNRVVAWSESDEVSTLDWRSTNALEITPGACTHTFTIASTTEEMVELRLSGACATGRRKPNRKTYCAIPADALAALPAPGPVQLVLSVDCKTSGQFSIGIPNVAVRGGDAVDDLRHDLTSSWTKLLNGLDGPNVVVISGEGGIGKTHLCRLLCDALHELRGYRCMSLTSTIETSESVFFRILWSLIVPDLGERMLTEPPERELIIACLRRLLADDRRAETELVADMIVQGDLRHVDVEVLTYLCARLLSRHPTPRALLITNAQHLAPHVIRAFELLFSALADEGWGDTRIFLEYRAGEETSRLRELLDRLRSDQHDRVGFLELQPLSEPEIRAALAPTVDGTQQRDLAAAIYRKAGGNPLFLTNVIRWAIDEGLIEWRPDRRLTVNDWPGLERELEALPASLDQFLDRRIARVLERSSDGRLLEFLIASSFSGYEIDEVQIRRTTLMTSAECASARFHWSSRGILSDAPDAAGTTFAHEIMMLSARSAAEAQEEFGNLASGILEHLDHDVFSDTLLGGRLSSALHQSRGALGFYNLGFELARRANAFHQQCLALGGAHGVLFAIPRRGEDLTRRFIDITLSLAEAELMGGSMRRADRLLLEALALAASEERTWPVPGETTVWRRRTLVKRIQLFVRLMRPREALQDFAQLLDAFGDRSTVEPLLRHSMTRILLALAMASRPAEACIVASALLDMWNEMTANERSSLCSDIGRIYLQTSPEIAAEWWLRGVTLATDVRQQAHSRLNTFVVDLLRGVPVPSASSAELRRNASTLGVHNQILRIDLADSILAVAAGDLDRARHVLNIALRLSRSTSQVFWEWKILNNLAVIAVKDDRRDDAARLFDSALSITEHVRGFATVDVAVGSLARQGSHMRAGPDLPPAPRFSGLWHLLVHNTQAMRRQEAVALTPGFAMLADAPLRVETRTGPLYLALE